MKVWILIFIKVNVQSYFIYSPTRSYVSIGHHQLVIGLESIDFSDQIKLWFVLFKQFENIIFLQTITSLEVNWEVSKWWFIREAVGFPGYFSWWVVGSGSGSGSGGPSCAVFLSRGTQYVATSDIDQTCRPLIGWEVRPVTILLVHLQQPILNRYCV